MDSTTSVALFPAAIAITVLVCAGILAFLIGAKENASNAAHKKNLSSQLEQLTAEHHLSISEQLYFTPQKLSLSIDPYARKFILSTKELAPTVFRLDDVTGVNVRNATDSFLELCIAWHRAVNAHAKEQLLFESVLEGLPKNVASIALSVADQEIILPFIINKGPVVIEESIRKDEAAMIQFAQALQKYLR